MALMFKEKNPTAFRTAMDILFWLIKESNVFAIPIPAINMALMDTRERNWEKLLITLFKPLAEFSGYLRITFSSSWNNISILWLIAFGLSPSL